LVAHLFGDWETSVALRMPGLDANANESNLLSPHSPAGGKSTASLFLDLLAQETEDSLPSPNQLDAGNPPPVKALSKIVKRAPSTAAAPPSKTASSHSLSRIQIQDALAATTPQTIPAPADKLDRVPLSAPELLASTFSNDEAASAPLLFGQLSTTIPEHFETGPSPLAARQSTVIPAKADAAGAAVPVALKASPGLAVKAAGSAYARASAEVQVSNPIPASASVLSTLIPVHSEAPEPIQPSAPKSFKLNTATSSPSFEPVTSHAEPTPATSDDDLVTALPWDASYSTFETVIQPLVAPAAVDLNALANAVKGPSSAIAPAVKIPVQSIEAQLPTTATVAPTPVRSPQTPPAQPTLLPDRIMRTTDASQWMPNASFTRRPDHATPSLMQTQKEPLRVAGLAIDPIRLYQLPESGKEAAELEIHHAEPMNSRTVNADRVSFIPNPERGSQTSAGNSATRDSKHEDSAAPMQIGNIAARPIQDSITAPAPNPSEGFASAVNSQLAGSGTLKMDLEPGAAAHAPQSNTSGDSPAPLVADADRSEMALAASGLGAVHSAKLIAQNAQSELRVGFQAGEFGKVDIRTSMMRSQITAEISVEHSELRGLLAVELPQLQTKLGAHAMTAADIVLTNETGSGSSSSRHAYQQNSNPSADASHRQIKSQSLPGLAGLTETQASTSQLDVHM
jgi:hypothetical protein